MSDVAETLFTLARAIYTNLTITMVEVGIHIFMALYGLSVFLETPVHFRKGRRRYIATSFVITALAALTASLDTATYFQVLLEAKTIDHWSQLFVSSQAGWETQLSITALGCLLIIGDGLLVYRCYMVYLEHWWVAILPGTTSVASIVLFFLANHQSESSPALLSADTLLTVITNIMVTTLIIFRLVRARRSISKLLPSSDGHQTYTGVIAILIESAAPLTIFGIVSGALRQAGRSIHEMSPGFIVCAALFDGLFYSFCSLSPHMIIFRVTTGRSFTKFPRASTLKDGALSNSLRFAHQTPESSVVVTSSQRL